MATAETRAHRRIRPSDLPGPLYWLWRKLTSVRVAISMITLMVLMALAAVIIPQVPPQLAGEATAVQQHIDDQRGTFGPFTDLLAGFPWFYDTRGGIFNLFSQPYWYALVAVVATAVSVCTVSRFPPIWRFVHRPTVRVGDRYFERARHRLDFATPADSGAIEAVLRRQRFRIRSEERDGARYLFADRYPWAQLATFASHLALLLLLLGTLITKFGAEEFQFWLGEGQSRPLFETAGDRQQIQVIVDDAIARFNDAGQALDFRSLVRVTSGGQEVAAGAVTVNGPLSAAGFRIHQAAYWEHGAALQVRDAGTGQLLYSETLFLDQQFFGPRVRVEDALTGVLRSEEVIALPLEIPDVPGGAYELIPLAPDRSLALALLPAGEGPPQFRYSVLPVGAAAGRSALPITSADLRLGEAPPPAPRVRIFDAGSGELLADDLIPLEDAGSEAAPGLRIGHLPLNDATTLTVGLDESGGVQRFFYFDLQDESRRGLLAPGERVTLDALTLEFVEAAPDGSHFGTLAPGERQRIGGVVLTYGGAEAVYFRVEEGIPGAAGEALLLLERFGRERTAAAFDARKGEDVQLSVTGATGAAGDGDAGGPPARLGIGLGDGRPRVDLAEGEAITLGDYEYRFLGPREFTGLTVRRDPGALILWVAIALGIAALLVTFFLPRRRLWLRITPQRTYMAGLAGHAVDLRAEMARLAADAGAADAVRVDDDWDDDG